MALSKNERKLAELILYVSHKSAHDPNFGQTKLHKILFFADFHTYGRWGEMITGATYQHLPHGPGVQQMMPIQEHLKSENALAIQRVSFFGLMQERPVPLRDPDLTGFSGQEIAIVDEWISRLWDKNASDVSYDSHETAGWAITSNGETIEPGTVFIAWGQPTKADVRRGTVLATKFGLLA